MTWKLGRVACLVIGLASLPLSTAAAKPVTLTYLGYLAGFPVLEMTAQADLPVAANGAVTDGVYGLTANIVTQGSLATLYPYRMSVSSNGRLAAGRSQPSQFHSEGQILQKSESVTLTYGQNGKVDIKAVPLTRQAQEAAAQGTANGTIDPASLVLAVIAGFAQKDTCTASYKLFDGVRRYDLNVTEVGNGNVETYKRSYYQGPATACQATPQLIQGFSPMAVQSQLYPESAKIWIANAVPGMPAVPVRIYTQNALGQMVFDLIAVQ